MRLWSPAYTDIFAEQDTPRSLESFVHIAEEAEQVADRNPSRSDRFAVEANLQEWSIVVHG